MFTEECNCEECPEHCEYYDEFVNFKNQSGLSQKNFAGAIGKHLSEIVSAPDVPEAVFVFARGDRVIVLTGDGAFQDEESREEFIRVMKAGWIYFQPEAFLWYAEAWSSTSEAVLDGRLRARDCPDRYEVIAANAYHVASGWRVHVEMKVEGKGRDRKVVGAEELDVVDEVGLRIMGRFGETDSGLKH